LIVRLVDDVEQQLIGVAAAGFLLGPAV